MPIDLYTDGSSSGKSNRPTGWAWVAVDTNTNEVLFTGSKGSETGTNNTSELYAVIDGLMECITKGYIGQVTVVADSQYALGISNGSYSPTKNLEQAALARQVYNMAQASSAWIKGHAGHEWNTLADKLAGEARLAKMPPQPIKTRKISKTKQQNKELKKKYLKEVSDDKK